MLRCLITIFSAAVIVLSASGCKKMAQPAQEQASVSASSGAARAETRAVTRIVFIDQQEACACTRKRIETSWNNLQEAIGKSRQLPVERIHLDTQSDLAAPYTEKRAVMVAPVVYFLDRQGEIIEMLQGEIGTGEFLALLH